MDSCSPTLRLSGYVNGLQLRDKKAFAGAPVLLGGGLLIMSCNFLSLLSPTPEPDLFVLIMWEVVFSAALIVS